MRSVVVFDTNILISAVLSTTGSPFRCLALAKIGQVESVTCPDILAEFTDKLQTKFHFSIEMAQAAVEEVTGFSRQVQITQALKVVPDDPDDDMVIECAVVGKATHVVTGDKHLLSLGSYEGILLLKARNFLDALSDARPT